MIEIKHDPLKTILVGIGLKANEAQDMEVSLDELAYLAGSAGCNVIGVMRQRLEKIVPATFIGSGKVKELARLKDETQSQLIIMDAKLSGIQQRNLQQLIGCKVIDRTQLIIEIFAQRAQTREGKLQVELAHLKDQLPRLIGEALAGLSKLAGGIGTRGPGESKLEMDRRQIQTRIEQVTKELEAVRKTRQLHRNRRKASRIPVIALVGYTNAGKSTLLNRLTKSAVHTEDKLFATLDPTTRKLHLPSSKNVLLTDTVGFINNLPHDLIEAFKATFEEINEADIILHIHDVAHPNAAGQSEVVTKLMKELGLNQPIIHVYNKADLIEASRMPVKIKKQTPYVTVSALSGDGIKELLTLIDEEINRTSSTVDLYLPASDPGLVFNLARDGQILFQESGDYIIHCRVKLSTEALQRWSSYLEPSN